MSLKAKKRVSRCVDIPRILTGVCGRFPFVHVYAVYVVSLLRSLIYSHICVCECVYGIVYSSDLTCLDVDKNAAFVLRGRAFVKLMNVHIQVVV